MTSDRVRGCLSALQRHFEQVHVRRMRDVPMMHPGLAVELIGFEPAPGAPDWLEGIVLTPWFMGLLRVPLGAEAEGYAAVRTGVERLLPFGRPEHDPQAVAFPFIGLCPEPPAAAAASGRSGFQHPYESCSLFSPMLEFKDSGHARAVALDVLTRLRARMERSWNPR